MRGWPCKFPCPERAGHAGSAGREWARSGRWRLWARLGRVGVLE